MSLSEDHAGLARVRAATTFPIVARENAAGVYDLVAMPRAGSFAGAAFELFFGDLMPARTTTPSALARFLQKLRFIPDPYCGLCPGRSNAAKMFVQAGE